MVRYIYKRTGKKLPIIGVGGIFNAADAWEKITAGASLVQVYTGFVYGGPTFATEVVNGLDAILKRHGFENLDQAIGSAAKGQQLTCR